MPRDLAIFGQGEKGKQNDLKRNRITPKIILRRPDDALDENSKSQQK
ncbi:hypothetical protein HYZ76_02065 [Candidatus Falkowbacteria bacterium]|nr:hypothetical protein [Candidatus Falkowbacteria bacterium]